MAFYDNQGNRLDGKQQPSKEIYKAAYKKSMQRAHGIYGIGMKDPGLYKACEKTVHRWATDAVETTASVTSLI